MTFEISNIVYKQSKTLIVQFIDIDSVKKPKFPCSVNVNVTNEEENELKCSGNSWKKTEVEFIKTYLI